MKPILSWEIYLKKHYTWFEEKNQNFL